MVPDDLKNQTARPSQCCSDINTSSTLVFKTFESRICKEYCSEMKDQSCVQSLLRREPCCRCCGSLGCFRACVPCRAVAAQVGLLEMLVAWSPGGVERRGAAAGRAGCAVRAGLCRQSSGTPLCTLWLRRSCPCRQGRLCPCRGRGHARHTGFPVGVNSRACHCTSCKNMMDLMEKKVLIVWFVMLSFCLSYG